MRQTDRARLDSRLKVLETRRHATNGARERLAAKLGGMKVRLGRVAPDEARAALLASLAAAPDTIGRAALRRAVLR